MKRVTDFADGCEGVEDGPVAPDVLVQQLDAACGLVGHDREVVGDADHLGWPILTLRANVDFGPLEPERQDLGHALDVLPRQPPSRDHMTLALRLTSPLRGLAAWLGENPRVEHA